MSAGSTSPSDSPRFQDVGREQKRRFILKAAAAAFGEKGFHAVSVKDIAGRAGIAHGTFYLYFKDKKDVYRALSRELRTQIVDVILPAGSSVLLSEGDDLAGVVRERLVGLGELFEREASFARVVVYRTPGTDPEFEDERRQFLNDVTDGIAAVLRAGVERGVIRVHDPRVAAMCLVGSMEMVIERWLQTLEAGSGPPLHEMMEEAARFFVPALVVAQAGAPAAEGQS